MAKIKSKTNQKQKGTARATTTVSTTSPTSPSKTTVDQNSVYNEVQTPVMNSTEQINLIGQVDTSAEQNQDTTNQAVQESSSEQRAVTPSVIWPSWPTSKPGPRATPPSPGTRSISAIRAEQMAEIGYNQETGHPGVESPLRDFPDERLVGETGFDQPHTAQEVIGKRKKRL